MPFDLLAWAIGYSVTGSTKHIAEKLFGKSLEKDIQAAVRGWAANLPSSASVHATALFPRIVDEDDLDTRPALRTLREKLRSNLVPTTVEWHLSLIEHWLQVSGRPDGDLQPFFTQPEEEARANLHTLAVALVQVCNQNDALFKGSVTNKLDELLSRASNTGELDLPDPFPWTAQSSLSEVALAIETSAGSPVAVLLIDQVSKAVHIWSKIPGATAAEIKRSLLTIACVASGIPHAKTIEMGTSSDLTLEQSDGCGPIGMMKVVLEASTARAAATTKTLPLDFWTYAKSYVLAGDGGPGQHWEEIPFRRFEESM